MIKEGFEEILQNYLDEQRKSLANNKLASLVRNDLVNGINDLATLSREYLVEGSVGQGNWAEVPWVCVFDREITTSAQKGFYIVYLFDAGMRAVSLSLNQGWTQYEKKYDRVTEARVSITATAERCQSLLRGTLEEFSFAPIDLHARNRLGKGYELGHICGRDYPAAGVPNDIDLVNDLRNLIGVYRELKGVIGTDIFNLELLRGVDNQQQDESEPLPVQTIAVNKELASAKTPEEIEEILVRIEEANRANEPKQKTRIAKALARNATIAKWVKEKNNFQCQICGVLGFEKHGGGRYAEVHHVQELARSGPDLPSNLVCVCPTCHRVIHYGSQEERKRRTAT